MLGWAGRLAGRAVLLEAGAAIIFFGSLMHQPKLVEYAARALQELRLRGYEIPTAADPVRAYPAATSEHFSSFHAGGWRPGVMVLRMHPEGGTKVEMVLRHELMHEASLRTCRGKLPLWAEEAAAMSFSGELSGAQGADMPTDADLANLRRRVRVGARLDPDSWRTLSSLVACYGWPTKPCARSETIEKLVSQPPAPNETGFSYVLVSLISGRLLEARGDLETCYPPGSLLKVPYAAALREAPPAEVSRELAASDTEQLLSRRANLEWERLRFLLSPARESALSASTPPEEGGGEDERFWRQCLGERAVDGGSPSMRISSTLPGSCEPRSDIARNTSRDSPKTVSWQLPRSTGRQRKTNAFSPGSRLWPRPEPLPMNGALPCWDISWLPGRRKSRYSWPCFAAWASMEPRIFTEPGRCCGRGQPATRRDSAR